MIRLVLSGAAGRMGQRLIWGIQEAPDLELVGALERPDHPLLGQDAGLVAGCRPTGIPLSSDPQAVLARAEVLVVFSPPEAALGHLASAAQEGRAAVVGTTGFSSEARRKIQSLSRKIPCVLAPNFSVGMNVLFWILNRVAPILGTDYDIEVVEAHHRHKQDAPSGTALRMVEILARALDRDPQAVTRYGRQGWTGERPREEIGVHALRAGTLVGEHTVLFAGIGEELRLTHRAYSRDNFVRGALLAARWVRTRPPGLYDMEDVLGLRTP